MIFGEKVIEAVVFDMDGTMFDTERLRMKMLKEASNQLKGYELSDQFLYDAFGLSATNSEALAKKTYGEDYPYIEVRHKSDELELEYVRKNGVPVKSGLYEVLERLKKSDILIALATSSRREIAMEYLERANVLQFFNIFVCGDEVSKGKPDPEIFLNAISELNVNPAKCLIIEDSENGLLAAYLSGALPIYIKDIKDCALDVKSKAYKCYDSMVDFADDLALFTPKMPVPKLNEHFPQSCENIKVGIHGFGAIGGGYLTQIFSHWDGYVRPVEIIGATRDGVVKNLINAYGRYSVLYERNAYMQTIRNIRIIDISDRQAMLDMYRQCVVIGLSIPENVIKLQAGLIAEGLIEHYKAGGERLTLLIILNKVRGGRFVSKHVQTALAELTDSETAKMCLEKTYFCETVVNRMVSQIPAINVMESLVNDVCNIERSMLALRSDIKNAYNLPSVKRLRKDGRDERIVENIVEKLNGLSVFNDLMSNFSIKLYNSESDMVLYANNNSPLICKLRQIKTVSNIGVFQIIKNKLSNGAHAILGWYAALLGYQSIGQGIGDKRILKLVKSIIHNEIRPALLQEYPEHHEYIDIFIERFIERCRLSFRDTCFRVGRDPLRKLQPEERILGAIKMAKEIGIATKGLEFGAACAILYSVKNINPKDEEAAFIKTLYEKNNSISNVLCFTGEYKGLKCKGLDYNENKDLIERISEAFDNLKSDIEM